MLREYVDHANCGSFDCDVCISIAGSALRELQWAQNQAFGCGVFRPSSDVREQRMKHSKDWALSMVLPESEKDFKALPPWLQKAIREDLAVTIAAPKHPPQSVGADGNIDEKRA